MAAIISRERAKATWLTGAVGLLILAAAFVMMACAPPSLVYARPHGAVTQTARAYTSSVITESWSANQAGRAGQVRHSRLGSAPAGCRSRLHVATRSPRARASVVGREADSSGVGQLTGKRRVARHAERSWSGQ